jgi:uncharacterized membrane protein YoaK (UPF0700 family)
MNPIVKNILAVIVGAIIGGYLNSYLIGISIDVIPPPEGVDYDPNDMESIIAAMPQFKPINFLMPFLAHALGTLLGAFIAAKFSASKKLAMAMLIGGLFLIGGIMVNVMIPGPTWFAAVDLIFAYIPMAWLGFKLAGEKKELHNFNEG